MDLKAEEPKGTEIINVKKCYLYVLILNVDPFYFTVIHQNMDIFQVVKEKSKTGDKSDSDEFDHFYD